MTDLNVTLSHLGSFINICVCFLESLLGINFPSLARSFRDLQQLCPSWPDEVAQQGARAEGGPRCPWHALAGGLR